MTVKTLIQELSKLDPSAEVLIPVDPLDKENIEFKAIDCAYQVEGLGTDESDDSECYGVIIS